MNNTFFFWSRRRFLKTISCVGLLFPALRIVNNSSKSNPKDESNKTFNNQYIFGTVGSTGKKIITLAFLKYAYTNNIQVLPFIPFAIETSNKDNRSKQASDIDFMKMVLPLQHDQIFNPKFFRSLIKTT
jgi:hypothetical protein